MVQNINSIPPYTTATLQELQEAAGVTQFVGTSEWNQITNGLQIQGGQVDVAGGASATVDFSAPYETQLLGVFLQVIGGAENGAYIGAAPTLADFVIHNGAGNRTYYWWAIGV